MATVKGSDKVIRVDDEVYSCILRVKNGMEVNENRVVSFNDALRKLLKIEPETALD